MRYKTTKLLIIVLAAFTLVFLISSWIDRGNAIKAFKKELKRIESENKTLYKKNDSLSIEIDTLRSKRIEIVKQKDDINERIIIIKEQTDEKVNRINNLSVDSIQLFLSNYRDTNRTRI